MDEIRIVVRYDGEWINKGGKIIYEGGKAKGIILSKSSSYKELHEIVCRALDIKPSEISMTMKFKYNSSCETVPPIEVVNDSDAKFFFGEVSDVSTRTPLCITVERKFDSTPVLAVGDEDCAKHDGVKTGLESVESRNPVCVQPAMPSEDAIRLDNFPKGIFDHIGSEPAQVLTSPLVTSTGGGLFGSTTVITGTGSSIFGISAGATSAAISQSLFSSPFTAGSARVSGTGSGVVTSTTQIIPVQFGSSATSSAFGLAGNRGFSSSSSPLGTSVSAAKPFSSSPTFGLNSSTSLSEANSISSGSGTTPSIFGSSWQAQKSPTLFGSTFSSSSTPATFSFNASTSSGAADSAAVFGASTGAPSSSIFPFTSTAAATSSQPIFGNGSSGNPFGSATAAAASSQPTFGNASSVNPFGSASTNNNDQISMEDSMAEDTVQSSTPTVAAFGQQSIPPAPSPSFVFGSTAPSYPFQLSSQQNLASPQNPSLFQASNSLDFNAGAAGGSFSLGSGGGDKAHRRIVKVSKGKQRRK